MSLLVVLLALVVAFYFGHTWAAHKLNLNARFAELERLVSQEVDQIHNRITEEVQSVEQRIKGKK